MVLTRVVAEVAPHVALNALQRTRIGEQRREVEVEILGITQVPDAATQPERGVRVVPLREQSMPESQVAQAIAGIDRHCRAVAVARLKVTALAHEAVAGRVEAVGPGSAIVAWPILRRRGPGQDTEKQTQHSKAQRTRRFARSPTPTALKRRRRFSLDAVGVSPAGHRSFASSKGPKGPSVLNGKPIERNTGTARTPVDPPHVAYETTWTRPSRVLIRVIETSQVPCEVCR
jgi:hypothetical protein